MQDNFQLSFLGKDIWWKWVLIHDCEVVMNKQFSYFINICFLRINQQKGQTDIRLSASGAQTVADDNSDRDDDIAENASNWRLTLHVLAFWSFCIKKINYWNQMKPKTTCVACSHKNCHKIKPKINSNPNDDPKKWHFEYLFSFLSISERQWLGFICREYCMWDRFIVIMTDN